MCNGESLIFYYAINPSNAMCSTGVIDVYKNGVKRNRPIGYLEARRHLCQEVAYNWLDSVAQDGIVRPNHADICDVGRAMTQKTSISRRHMSVCSDDRAGAAVQEPAHG